MIAILQLVFLCSAASAACDLTYFDRTPPAAIRSPVDNQFAHFEWATDADTVNGRTWIWNYILNLGNAGLSATWEKGKIRIPLLKPLPPTEAFCNRYLVKAVSPDPDTDAPIVYGTNNQRQEAAVYTEQHVAQVGTPDTASIIETTVRDDDGKLLPVRVEISTSRTAKGVSLSFTRTPGLVLGISNLLSGLDSNQVANVKARLGSENVNLQESSISDYVGGQANLNGVFAANELKDREGMRYFFLSGGDKGFVEIEGSAFEDRPAEMVVLDRNRKPLLVAGVNMLLPVSR
jgi:hypothetical protein